MRQPRGFLAPVLLFVALAATPVAVRAQEAAGTLRVALLPEWVVGQHRTLFGGTWLAALFTEGLDRGVVDRVVFSWQRGLIQRSALVTKPLRILPATEVTALGGRGGFRLLGVTPPPGPSAWTELRIGATTDDPQAVAVIEVGGELSPVTQIVETVLVAPPGGALTRLPLAPRALARATTGVPVVQAPFDRPIEIPGVAAWFRGVGGIELLVVRSQVEAVRGGTTPNGVADVSPGGYGNWREGDRVLIRVPLTVLREPGAAVVLGWRDRILREDPRSDRRLPVEESRLGPGLR